MTPYYSNSGIDLYHGDALEVVRGLPDESVHCTVTSPPYWALRDYKKSGQWGLEPTPEQYLEHVVELYREIRRVLRKDGTAFINMGDGYAQGGKAATQQELSGNAERTESKNYETQAFAGYEGWNRSAGSAVSGLKPKDLIMMPARLALALQADGWYLRSQIIWAKSNPMPESVTDRPTKSYELIYLLSRSNRYYYDADAVREKQAPLTAQRARYGWNGITDDVSGGARTGSTFTRMAESGEPIGTIPTDGYRNQRDVWPIPTKPYTGPKKDKADHFATFPPEIPRRCIKAGTSEHGCCAECGVPWKRLVEKTASTMNIRVRDAKHDRLDKKAGMPLGATATQREITNYGKEDLGHRRTLGWEPTCECNAGEPVPCVVLDPFIGSGTTAEVAYNLRRKCIGIDISEDYLRDHCIPRVEKATEQGVLL